MPIVIFWFEIKWSGCFVLLVYVWLPIICNWLFLMIGYLKIIGSCSECLWRRDQFYYEFVKTVGREGNWIMLNSYWNICYWFLQHSGCEIRLSKWILLGKLFSSLMTVEMDGMCRIWKVNRKFNWFANQLNQKGIWKGYFPIVN
jgi:hypothetical protein